MDKNNSTVEDFIKEFERRADANRNIIFMEWSEWIYMKVKYGTKE